MNKDTSAVRSYFTKLGFESEIADLYLALYAQGPQSISELSRNSGVERTRIYRLIDTLMASNLIEVETHYKKGIMKAAPIANLHILIAQREQELKSLQDELGLIEQVLNSNSLSSPATRVQFYRGAEGAKQMFWNQTKATTERLTILSQPMQVKTGKTFFERWVSAINENGVSCRSIASDAFSKNLNEWRSKNDSERSQLWVQRHVSPAVYDITHDTAIYDDVVAYSNWKEGEIFGVEIHNPEVANSQRQLFELLWNQSTEVAPITP